ncbi:MAG: Glycosyl transferase, group 1 family [Candidatus Moranbacteria bacterium GW2011_GWC2_37_73]|nr:MAG: Glycosyl transferase, group 1 family [Parcubacteria group bacterium GW2011_GWC1_36_108]KKQ01270.1 MAG: Glycosyl transferase, group 1 family [Candidatus Moranbacteria bacterium GW2011_GWD1_36_198]KKQ02329.1 MAG: Glycosyl transferase, group 1 family [Candidatus Moranbacteria bacterium GW2011_GWD2_36_198]KKQ40224.1 MAG: Glycosyl transferase, group 1 family [Candidatus Moranbacteria bacterium GW2011_GWC2_37_73]
MNNLKILFISRAYPPTVGGIENQNYELATWLGEIAEIKIIANTRGRKFLPVFAPYALLRALFLMPRYDALLIGDGTLAILSWIIKLFYKKPTLCVVHGLDINYGSSSLGVWYEKILIKLYQTFWIGVFIKSFDKLIAVGNETIKVGIEKNIPAEKFVFIPNGVDTEKHLVQATQTDLEKIIGKSTADKKVLMTSGRLAKRKGVAWFISNVMPKLDENFLYVVAGAGPDKENISQAIKNNRLENRVAMLGYIPDEDRNILWATADLFVQPNIKIAGDMEGFGISVIEAGACRLPVLASNMEGLKDAIKEGKNGFLVESENAEAYVQKINELFTNGSPRETYGQKVRDFVIENYQWKRISQIYLSEIEKAINNKRS